MCFLTLTAKIVEFNALKNSDLEVFIFCSVNCLQMVLWRHREGGVREVSVGAGEPEWDLPGAHELLSEELPVPVGAGRGRDQALPHTDAGRRGVLHRQQDHLQKATGETYYR